MPAPPVATLPVAFFDPHTGRSALAIQHLRADGRTVLLFHDAPGPVAAQPLLCGVAESLAGELGPGQALTMIETGMPEHPVETFVYARVSLARVPTSMPAVTAGAGRGRSVPPWSGARLSAHSAGTLSPRVVALLCGITATELARTEQLVIEIHRPRSCAFPGIRQLALGRRRPATLRAVA